MKRPFSRSIRPRLEALEDRCVLSAASGVLSAPATASSFPLSCPANAPPALVASLNADVDKSAGHEVPFKEHLKIVAVSSDGVYSYEGHATHFGHLTAESYPDGTFVKTAANGDSVFGQLYPASPTNGTLTFNGGTGRFASATGTASYVISTDPSTGVSTVDLVGSISYNAGGQTNVATAAMAAANAGTQVLPFKVNGGGTAPVGVPVIPGLKAPYNATGIASHLGKYTGDEGVFELLSIDFATLSGTFRGSIVFVAANGDRLAFNYGADPSNPGTFTLNPTGTGEVRAVFVAEFTPDAAHSTGRFAQVTGGSFTMTATSEPFVPVPTAEGFTPPFAYTWVGDGTLEFGRGKK